MSLSDRIRPGVECAPWVIEEIHKLEAQRAPILTVDVVLLTLDGDTLKVALHRRKQAPFQGCLALPGGYVHVQEDEDMADAAHRILREKTGFEPTYLEQLEVFSGPQRDPRRTISQLDDSAAETGIRSEVRPGLHRFARLHDLGA